MSKQAEKTTVMQELVFSTPGNAAQCKRRENWENREMVIDGGPRKRDAAK